METVLDSQAIQELLPHRYPFLLVDRIIELVPRERIVGISRYSADHEGLHCEFAVTVTDQWQNKGLGTLLMKYLIDVARTRGIRTMTSIDSAVNMQMKYLARHLGFDRRIDPEDATQVIHELHL